MLGHLLRYQDSLFLLEVLNVLKEAHVLLLVCDNLLHESIILLSEGFAFRLILCSLRSVKCPSI